MANNHSDGDLKKMLLHITLQKHKGLIECFNQYTKRIKRLRRGKIKYNISKRKGCIHIYISAMPMKRKEKESFSKGYWALDIKEYWNLDAENTKPLKDFWGKYFV